MAEFNIAHCIAWGVELVSRPETRERWESSRLLSSHCIVYTKGPFTRAIFEAIFLILTHAIEPLSHKSIDLYSFAQMV